MLNKECKRWCRSRNAKVCVPKTPHGADGQHYNVLAGRLFQKQSSSHRMMEFAGFMTESHQGKLYAIRTNDETCLQQLIIVWVHAGPTPHHNHWLDVALAAFKHRLQCQYLNALSSSMASLHWNQRSEPQMSTSQLLAQTLSSHLGEPRRQYSESPATCRSNTIKRLNANIGLQLKSCLFVVVLSV